MFGPGSIRSKAAGAVVACAVMLLAGCGGSGGSAAEAGAPVIRGDGAEAPSTASVSASPTASPSASSTPGPLPAPTIVAGDGEVTVIVVAGIPGGPESTRIILMTSGKTTSAVGTCEVPGVSGSCVFSNLILGNTYTAIAQARGPSVYSSTVSAESAAVTLTGEQVNFYGWFDEKNIAQGAIPRLVASKPTALPRYTIARPGYTFEGWANLRSPVYPPPLAFADGAIYPFTESIELVGRWIYTGYAVTFDANGGTRTMANQTSQKASTLTSNAFERTGYTFDGWATSSDGDKAYANGASYPFTANATLYARWVPVTYSVTFVPNGGSGTQLSPLVSTAGSSVIAPASTAYTKAGNSFSGWNTAANGTGTTYAAGSAFTPTSTMTIYAQWQSDVTVTFVPNGGSGTQLSPLVSTAGSSVIAPASTAYTKAGNSFSGWNTSANGTGTTYAAGSAFTPTSTMTIYAQWQSYPTVTFAPNGGTGTMAAQSAPSSTTLTANAFTRLGYVFAGWATSSNGSTAYANGASYPFAESETLYGRWGCLPLTVEIGVRRTDSTTATVGFSASVGNKSRSPWTSFTTTSVSVTYRGQADTTKGGQTATVRQSSYKGNIAVGGLNGYTTYTFTVTATNAAGCSYTSVVSKVI